MERALRQKLRYFGHVMRSNGLEKDIMMGMGDGSRRIGRPRSRWADEVLNLTNMTLQQLKEQTRDRATWRRITMDATRGLAVT